MRHQTGKRVKGLEPSTFSLEEKSDRRSVWPELVIHAYLTGLPGSCKDTQTPAIIRI
jgi:hypothetical protein